MRPLRTKRIRYIPICRLLQSAYLLFYFYYYRVRCGYFASSAFDIFFFLPICRLLQLLMVRCGLYASVYHKSDHTSGFTTESILSEYLHECCVYVCITSDIILDVSLQQCFKHQILIGNIITLSTTPKNTNRSFFI